MAASDSARALDLVLAASAAPLSIDTILGWNLARPAELWGLLSAAQGSGKLAQVEPGHFAFRDPAARDEALARAGPEDWARVLASSDRLAWMVDAARAAAAEQRPAAATAILRALVAGRPRDAFP